MIKKRETTEIEWNGFKKPEYPSVVYFKTGQDFFNILPLIKGEATLKILFYVYRHTLGSNNYNPGEYVHITTEEFMNGRLWESGIPMDNGTGLCKNSVLNGIDAAESQGFLEIDIDDSDRARIKKSYRLHLAGPKPIAQKKKDPLKELGFNSYQEYLNSPQWKEKADKIKKEVGRCQLCASKIQLQVHHNTYDNIGNEKREDLTVLCSVHHADYENLKKQRKLLAK